MRSVYRKIHLFSYRPKDSNESVLTESNSTAPGTEVGPMNSAKSATHHATLRESCNASTTCATMQVVACDSIAGRLGVTGALCLATHDTWQWLLRPCINNVSGVSVECSP